MGRGETVSGEHQALLGGAESRVSTSSAAHVDLRSHVWWDGCLLYLSNQLGFNTLDLQPLIRQLEKQPPEEIIRHPERQ